MKKTRRIAAFIAAMAMAATMAVPSVMMTASAVDVTIKGNKSTTGLESTGTEKTATEATQGTHTYEAYQIFTGKYDGGVLTEIDWGSAVKGTKNSSDYDYSTAIITALNADDNFTIATGATAEAVSKLLEDKTADSTEAQAFAKIVGNILTAKEATAITKTTSSAVSGNDNDQKLEGLTDGYYLIADAKNSPIDSDNSKENDAKTRYILKVSDSDGDAITIVPKSSAPKVFKKVYEDDKTVTGRFAEGAYTADTHYNDVADYSVGETVKFELIGTMPSTYDDYTSYFYQFTDTLGKEFTYDATATNAFKVYAVNTVDDEAKETDITSNFTAEKDTSVTNANKFTLTCNDVKSIKVSDNAVVKKDTVIVVRYEAVLNKNAVIGMSGQENKVDLTYSNNPNYTGTGANTPDEDKSKTPEDKVIVFTYEVDFDKTETGKPTTKLLGAEFALEKEVKVTVNGTPTTKKYVATAFDDTTQTVTTWAEYTTYDETNGYKNGDDAVTPYKFTTTGKNDDEDVYQKVVVKGLDDNSVQSDSDYEKYFLRETKAPATYNKLTAPVEFKVTANTVNNQTWGGSAATALVKHTDKSNEYESVKLTIGNTDTFSELGKDASGNDATTTNTNLPVTGVIENAKGATLPSTGGMGTVLFYTVGGVLVIGAGVVLVTKKRMGKED